MTDAHEDVFSQFVVDKLYHKEEGTACFAPYLDVKVSTLMGSIMDGDTLPARIDTGADITCVPEAAIKHLMPVLRGKSVVVRGHDGHIKRCHTYLLSISLLGYPDDEQIETVTPERGVLVTNSNIVLVGADITSRFLVTMDGPKQMFSMSRH